jgi:hypothetical protein
MRTLSLLVVLYISCTAAIILGQDIPHKVMNRDCSDCHSETKWKSVRFDHNKTRFTLIGRHLTISCSSCHQLDDFQNIKTDCVNCHLDVHQGKLARSCNVCHTPQGWSVISGVTAHANTSFPLLGAHARLDCKACHTGEIQGEFSLLRSECVSCHDSDFRNAPVHNSFGAIVRCEECHNLLAWRPANFSKHDQQYFPIYSGNHSGRWSTCAECHTNAGNFAVFECINCHEHSRSRMDGSHAEVAGYEYTSVRCYNCHPRGSGGN